MPYALVIFDLDGTLADSFPWFLGVLNTVAREFKFREVAEGDIEPLRHCSVHEILRKLDVPLWKVPQIAHRMRVQKARRHGAHSAVSRRRRDAARSG
jgi:phosphoglycolate phosphatase